jgi:hypothetical protein
MRVIPVIAILSLLFTGCKKSDQIIPEKDFQNMLVELHLADGIYNMNYGKYMVHTDSLNFYNTIFKNYGYTRAQFDSTIKYYTVNPKEFDIVYDKVIDKLIRLEGKINEVNRMVSDSVDNRFKLKTTWNLPLENKATRIPFDISVEDSAEYEISVYAKKYNDDQSENLRITAFYWITDTVTKQLKREMFPEVKYKNGSEYNLYNTSLIYPYKKKGRLRGWILNHDNKDNLFKKHVEIKLIYIEKKLMFPKR